MQWNDNCKSNKYLYAWQNYSLLWSSQSMLRANVRSIWSCVSACGELPVTSCQYDELTNTMWLHDRARNWSCDELTGFPDHAPYSMTGPRAINANHSACHLSPFICTHVVQCAAQITIKYSVFEISLTNSNILFQSEPTFLSVTPRDHRWRQRRKINTKYVTKPENRLSFTKLLYRYLVCAMVITMVCASCV